MQVFRRFKADQRGAAATLFGLSVLPLLGFAGAAVDYSRAARHQTQMQRAVDQTALAIVNEPASLTAAEVQRKGETLLFNALPSEPALHIGGTSITRVGNTVKVAAAASMDTAIMKVLGFRTMAIATSSEAVWGSDSQKVEIAFVLDNTGSMNDLIGGKRKIDELISATQGVLKDLRAKATGSDLVKASLVPFDTEVRLDTGLRNKSWLRWDDEARDKPAWTGYVIDRYGSYAATDLAPAAGNRNSLYPALRDSEYRRGNPMGAISTADLPAMRGLTDLSDYSQWSDLNATVGSMRPRGYTNLTLGVTWGAATLSASEPFTGGVAQGTPGVKKILILVTDGKNTARHVDGAVQNAEWERTASTRDKMVDAMNAATLQACQNAKSAGVEIFAVRLLEGDTGLLQSCATDANHYKDVQKSGELSAYLQASLSGLLGTRLTH